MKKMVFKLISLASLSVCLPSCILIGNKATDCASRNIGAELLDLKKAKDHGLISEEQYRKQHERILADPSQRKKDTKN